MTYTTTRNETSAGFKHGQGVTKTRQGWEIGDVVKVGFVSGLMVVGKNDDGSYSLVTVKGKRYVFAPHQGLGAVL